jgi:site-specific DNA-adenine methylase
MEAIVQVIGAAIIAMFTGASAYQLRSNKAQDERLGKLELEMSVIRGDLINFNDVILSQFGHLNDRMDALQEQRKEVAAQQDIRFNHLDSLLGGLYRAHVKNRDRSAANND